MFVSVVIAVQYKKNIGLRSPRRMRTSASSIIVIKSGSIIFFSPLLDNNDRSDAEHTEKGGQDLHDRGVTAHKDTEKISGRKNSGKRSKCKSFFI